MSRSFPRRSPGRFLFTLCAGACLMVAAGCNHNVYQLEMKATPDGLERSLTCWRKSGNNIGPMPEDELKRIAAQYHTAVEPPLDRQHHFRGTFTDKLPEDVGGTGYFVRHENPLGTSYAYQERFRGDVDTTAALARRAAACDELTNLAIGFLEQQLGSEPGYPRLREFLDTQFRGDLKNISLQFWFAALEPKMDAAVRIAHYLAERGYGSPAEMLRLMKGLTGTDEVNEAVPRFLAEQLGLPPAGPYPASFAFLESNEAFQQALEGYFRSTDEYQRRQAEWEKRRAANPDEPPLNPTDQVVEVMGRAFLSGPVLTASDELSVKLATGVKPYATNGAWQEGARQVVWTEQIEGANTPAAFCFALWSEPNRDAQRARFGQVLLEGEDLHTYIGWYQRLNADRQRAWDNFLATLKPGLGLEARIGGFRFADDPQPERADDVLPSAADPARQLLLKRLLPH